MSVVRAGECLEPALIEVYKDAKIGKILIQTNQSTGEPEVFDDNLPFFFRTILFFQNDSFISYDYHVILPMLMFLFLMLQSVRSPHSFFLINHSYK